MTQRAFGWGLFAATIFIAAWIATPFLLYPFQDGYGGLVPFRTLDDGSYEARIQSALLGRYDEASNSITGPEFGIRGTAPVAQEVAIGWLFRWSGLKGPHVAMLLMVVFTPLIVTFLGLMLRRLGASPAVAIGASLAYVFVFLTTLQRPVNGSLSLPLTALILLLLLVAWQKGSYVWGSLAGIALGILPGTYFWAWTFLWAGAALLLLYHFFLPSSPEKHRAVRVLLFTGAIALIVSLPFLYQSWFVTAQHPFFSETAYYRSCLYPSRAIPSVPRGALLLLATIAANVLFRRHHVTSRWLVFPVVFVTGAFLAMHQNLLHGKDFQFASHYYPFVCLSLVTLSAWILSHAKLLLGIRSILRSWPSLAILSITALFLTAGLWDYRMMWSILRTAPDHLKQQHLRPILEELTDGGRQTILTDNETGLMIKAWTDDDVVWVQYAQHLLISNREYAERACTTALMDPSGPDIREIAWHTVQFRGQHLLPDRIREFTEYCEGIRSDPQSALQRFGVDLLLWNERTQPNWQIDPELFEKVEQGEGWSLWRVKE